MARSKPYVILSAATSIDGKIATRTGKSKLSSQRDLERLHRLRSRVDAVLVGKKTISMDNPLLTVRHVRGKNPARIVLDPRASMPANSRVVMTAGDVPTIAAVSEMAPARRIATLEKRGVEVIMCGRKEIDLKKLLAILAGRGMKRVLVEGGGETNWHFLRDGLVDEIVVTITPYVIGGNGAVSLVGGEGFAGVICSFRLKEITRMGSELLLRYVP